VLPECRYVARLIAKQPQDYLDLVPAEARGRYALPVQA
jgi:hypothetical protein